MAFSLPAEQRPARHGLGSYPAVTLSEARIAAADARKLMAQNVDPLNARAAERKAAKPIPTFEDIAKIVIEEAKHKSTNEKVKYQWERHLGEAYSGPLLKRPVNEITTLDVAAVLKSVWTEKPEVARKLYPAIRRVFEYARIQLRDDHGIAMPDNPARWDDLKAMGFARQAKLSRAAILRFHTNGFPRLSPTFAHETPPPHARSNS